METNTTTRLNRYPGAQPFQTSQEAIFFGREEDRAQLHRYVKLESLVVLYAKSGLGKSSLINAGLIPKIQSEGFYTPLSIRFGAYQNGCAANELPEAKTRLAVASKGSQTTFLDKLIENEPTLWHDLKEAHILSKGKTKFLLVFDQFEELFTYPKEAIIEFKEQLAEVLYAKLPQRYRSELEYQVENNTHTWTDAEFETLQEPLSIRILMAIRADRLSMLNDLTDFLPSVMRNLFELSPLSNKAAESAIIEPAAQKDAIFLTPSFTYTPEAVAKIVDFLTDNETERIESTQLQIICQTVEEKIKHEGQVVSADDLGDLTSIIENYYEEKIKTIPTESEQLAARQLIEDALIFEEEERRLSLYEGVVLRYVTPDTLKKLVDSHLLRAEPTMDGGLTYELSHDSMVRPVLKAKQKRREQDTLIEMDRLQKLKVEQEKIEKQKRVEDLKRIHERRNRRITQLVASVMTILTVFSMLALWYAVKQKNAVEGILVKLETERQIKEGFQSQLLLQDAYTFMQAEEWEFALQKLNEAQPLIRDAATLTHFKEYTALCHSKIEKQ